MTQAMGVGLEGRRVRLERVRIAHVPALFDMAQTPGWPLAGAGLDMDRFVEELWSSSPLQFAVIRQDTDEVIGLVRGQHWDQRSGTIEVVFAIAPSCWRLLWPFEGAVIFCDYLLRGLGMRKLYFELRPSSLEALGSWVRRRCVREWVKPDELRSADGGFEDVEVWSVRDLDYARVDRMLGRSRAGAVGAVGA